MGGPGREGEGGPGGGDRDSGSKTYSTSRRLAGWLADRGWSARSTGGHLVCKMCSTGNRLV